MTKLNIAVVGAGLYGKNHLDAYSVNSNVNLVAVCDLNREITDRVAKEYGVKTYNDIEEMLNNEEIDAVSVATPDPYHKDPVMAAIRHGKHVLVEKPLATTSTDAYEIIEAAKKATGQPIEVKIEPRRPGDPAKLVANTQKARDVLGWTPRYTDVEEIIRTAWNFYTRQV